VALGIYARVMQALGLEQDLALVAVDDVLGRKLQDAALPNARRAAISKAVASPPAGG